MRDERSIEELERLCEHLGETQTMNLVEVGSYQGESTELFAMRFRHVTAVDCWDLGDDLALQGENVERQGNMRAVEDAFDERMKDLENVTKVKAWSREYAELCGRNFDGVYIDAGHSYKEVLSDIELWAPRVFQFVSGHDWRDVRLACLKFFERYPDWRWGGSWLYEVK